MQKHIQNSVKHRRWSVVRFFHKTLHLRCLTGFWILLCLIKCSTKRSSSFVKVSSIEKEVLYAFITVCFQIPKCPSYFLIQNVMLAFTHLLSFWRSDSVKYGWLGIGHLQHTWFLCNAASEVNCVFQFQVMKLKMLFWEKGCDRGRDRIRQKRKLVSQFHLNSIK